VVLRDRRRERCGRSRSAPAETATLAETERIARECPPEELSIPVLVAAIRRQTGCSRASAYRAVSDALTAGVLGRTKDDGT